MKRILLLSFFIFVKKSLSANVKLPALVSSEKLKQPVAVRYNWGNSPDGNLYNKENLPAVPFRTDTW